MKITRSKVSVKLMFVQAAHAAVKCKTKLYYKIKHENILQRRIKKRTIIAIACMILTAIYHVLQIREVFNPSDLRQIDMPEELKVEQKQRETNNTIELLRQQEFLAEDLQY